MRHSSPTYLHRWRAERKALGMCVDCKPNKARPGRLQCFSCAERQSRWAKRHYPRINQKERNERRAKRYRESHIVRAKMYYNKLSTNYGIDTSQFHALLIEQCGKCAMCWKDLDERSPSLKVAVDHTTVNGIPIVRGLLHRKCNLDLGYYEKAKENAEKYLACQRP